MSKVFCALPFQHMCFGPEGSVRLCCMMEHQVTEHGAPMSMNVNTMEQIWNSAYMRNVRRAMLEEKPVKECNVCYASEQASGQSYRTTAGAQIELTPYGDFDELKRKVARNGYRVDWDPSYIKLEVGNLCNLKCRMCYGGASSEIERDPVHIKWSDDIDPLHVIWRGEMARVGPEPRIGVRSSGFHAESNDGRGRYRWTDGHAILAVPVAHGTRLSRLTLSFLPPPDCKTSYQILVGGKVMAQGSMQDCVEPVEIDLSRIQVDGELLIEIVSNVTLAPSGKTYQGVPVAGLQLFRDVSAQPSAPRPEHLWQRRRTTGPWYTDDNLLFGEILKSPEKLRRLYITGGEPFIIRRVGEILDFLIDAGAASHVELEISTNCTRVDPKFVAKLKKFSNLSVYLSLDSIGATYEYIRYPARWETVDANVRRLLSEPGLRLLASPVVQIYNVVTLPDLFRYFDSLNLDFYLNILHQPDRLAIRHLPPKTRKTIAERLLAYHDHECRPHHKNMVMALAQYLSEPAGEIDWRSWHELMLFTNDLDATRGQSFAASNPELLALLESDGIKWIDETLHAKTPGEKKPARERVYAWL